MTDTELLIEDKLFIVAQATSFSGELNNNYRGGINDWMTLEQINSQTLLFKNTNFVINALQKSETYIHKYVFLI